MVNLETKFNWKLASHSIDAKIETLLAKLPTVNISELSRMLVCEAAFSACTLSARVLFARDYNLVFGGSGGIAAVSCNFHPVHI